MITVNQECEDNTTSSVIGSEVKEEEDEKVEDAIVTESEDKQQDASISETEDNE